jgi:uncharacterized protein YbbC (DUF1343 family)
VAAPAPTTGCLPGIDVLLRDRREVLSGRHVGLVTNTTGRSADGTSTIDLLHAETDWQLVALFSPEHGIRGDAEPGQAVDSSLDQKTGLPVHSLYGETTRPTPAMLRGLDALAYDIQDVGARVFTYTSTLLEVMRAGAAAGVPVVVLDRPNPIGGDQIEGNVLDPRFASFVGAGPICMRYGMTIGELGQFFNAEMGVGADLTVVPLQGWRRSDWFDATGLGWVNPSPNMRSLTAAALYPGTVLVEGTNLSEGRGTDRPFEWIGAPWVDGPTLAEALNAAGIAGVRFAAASRTPESSKHAGVACQGVDIQVTDRLQLRPMELGVTMLSTLRSVSRGRLQITASNFDHLAGTDHIRTSLEAGSPGPDIARDWQANLRRFAAVRQKYLLY